ncbi:uncharacterized protein BDV14DRAFT_198821 [Aspergillus stella-maris]|uniref:uncharacterized protein n=1 Tax=Aspergillus stella-maris TaxID=1810926 RepID=UPI003CCE0194
MRLFHSLVATVGVGIFIRPAFADVTATSLFETIPSGTDGNCDGKDLDTMVEEAINLNNAAIRALDILTQDKVLSTSGNEGRYGELASAIWGVFIDQPVLYFGYKYRFDKEDRDKLNQIKGYFNMVNEKLLSGSNSDSGKLVCGATDWVYAKTFGDIGYTGEEQYIDLPQDIYISKYWSQKDEQDKYIFEQGKIIATHEEERHGNSLCDPPVKAETWANSKLIMMCDSCFTQSKLYDLYAEQDSWEEGKYIDELVTAGSEFQHEMFHYLNEGIGDQKVAGKPAYGWINTVTLAAIEGGNPVKNADNYRVFATAVFFDRVTWTAEGTKEASE